MISGKTRSPIPDQDTTQSVKMANRVQTAQIATAKVKFPQESRRAKMWLNTTEKDPQKFQAEVENVCRTYLEAAAKAAADGTHT